MPNQATRQQYLALAKARALARTSWAVMNWYACATISDSRKEALTSLKAFGPKHPPASMAKGVIAARALKYLLNFVVSINSAATPSLLALPFLRAATDARETTATSM